MCAFDSALCKFCDHERLLQIADVHAAGPDFNNKLLME
jgi:hypothetical protein